MKYLFFIFILIISTITLASSVLVPTTRDADAYPDGKESNGGTHWSYKCLPHETLLYNESHPYLSKCRSCPTDYKINDLNQCIKDEPEPPLVCNEVWKEIRDGKCVAKQCTGNLSLDTKDGKCKDLLVCPPWQEKLVNPKNGNSYCASFCDPGYIRDQTNACVRPPPKPIVCNPDQTLIDGICVKKQPPCDLESKWSMLCEFYEDFKSFSKTSIEKLNDLDNNTYDLYEQNEQFYADVRLFLENYDPETNVYPPTVQFPDLPEFCDYSRTMCDWYIDWQDWRNDYNKNELLAQQQRQKTIENQEKQLDEDKSFYDDARDFFDFIKETKEEETPTQPEQPSQPEEPAPPEPDDQQRVSWSATCPITQPSQSITLEGQTTTIQGFDMSEACSMAAKMRPLILLAGALISLLIIARGHS